MLKAVLFDDEFIVLKGLVKLIDWAECGVELAGTAKDGLEALRLFRELKPDIVLTDIRMPGLDGLQLIEKIRQEAPETVCIVFSGYNEFEYVKKAIHLGVVDYLEKPITLSKIQEGVQKAVRRVVEHAEMKALKQQERRIRLEKSTLELLHHGQAAAGEWELQFGPDAERVTGITVLVCTEESFRLESGESYRAVAVRSGTDNVIAVFHFDAESRDWMEQLADYTDGTVGSGGTYSSVAAAPGSYKEAQRALRYGNYLEGRGWIRFEDIGGADSVHPQLSELEEEMLFQMRIGDKQQVMDKVDSFLNAFRSMKLDPEVAESELMRIVFLGMEAAKETGEDPSSIHPSGYLAQRELRSMLTQEKMAAWLRGEMETIMDWIVAIRQRSKHAAVEKALRYINECFGRDLTQQEVADHVGMNATYFSLLFKEQMGISYIKYLTKIRMEKAKQLLGGELPIQDISERVGYYHARHFSEVFKKHTGLTPGQYRSKGKIG